MDDAALTRYSRHLLLNEWGIEAQDKLSAAKVLIIGAGGLGCPVAQQLACSGVGTLTIADGDTVDATNLMRQTLHTASRIGMNKALSAQLALHDMNPLCTLVPIASRLSGQALLDAVRQHDMVLDCCDNFATRHAVNHACVQAKKPLFSAAAIRFDGQWVVFNAANPDSACYHCLFPEPVYAGSESKDQDPKDQDAKDQQAADRADTHDDQDRCAVMGVFAPLTQLVGTHLASAALRYITGVGQVALNTLNMYNALDGSQHSLHVPKDLACAVCGDENQQHKAV
jgi:molybdopterin/thiamine biosynthesis adenylyltransferase